MNTYGLDAYSVNLHVQRFATEFATRYIWQAERQKAIFTVTVQNIIRMPENAGKYAGDFCDETGMARQEFDKLMSNMFYMWDAYVQQVKRP